MLNIHSYSHTRTYFAAWSYNGSDEHDKLVLEIRKWCRDNFGDSAPDVISISDRNEYRWKDYASWGEIEFKHEKDLNWFILRWHN